MNEAQWQLNHLPPEAEQGRAAGGTILQEASAIAAGCHSAGAELDTNVLLVALPPQSAILLNEFLTELSAVSNRTIYYRSNLIASDPDDNKFVDACIEGNADYLVTADYHFDMLAEIPFPNVNVISPKEFLTLLKNHTP